MQKKAPEYIQLPHNAPAEFPRETSPAEVYQVDLQVGSKDRLSEEDAYLLQQAANKLHADKEARLRFERENTGQARLGRLGLGVLDYRSELLERAQASKSDLEPAS